jgi:hypothetical protein
VPSLSRISCAARHRTPRKLTSIIFQLPQLLVLESILRKPDFLLEMGTLIMNGIEIKPFSGYKSLLQRLVSIGTDADLDGRE